jgi:DNA-binding CsgD family transcriptional regulator
MTCGAIPFPDVLGDVAHLIRVSMDLRSPEAFDRVVPSEVERCMPGVVVTCSSDRGAGRQARTIEIDALWPERTLLAVPRGHEPLSTCELDLLALLTPHLRRAFRASRCRARLTPREFEVLTLVGEGLTNRQVARRLSISPGTVRAHLEHAFPKLGVGNRTEAIVSLG